LEVINLRFVIRSRFIEFGLNSFDLLVEIIWENLDEINELYLRSSL
jgi:hypothetical protein